MAINTEYTLSPFPSQLVVLALLAVFMIILFVAMFSDAGVANEMDWIGMTVSTLGAEAAAARGIPNNTGVMVKEVEGIAARSGVRHGDVLLAINGNRIRDMVDFSHLVGQTDLSKRGVQLDVIRNGSRVPIFVITTAQTNQAPGQTSPGGNAGTPRVIDRKWLGIDAETFTADEARALGIPAGIQGVLIDGVTKGSKADQAGLVARDLIVSVNGLRINTTADLWNTLATLNSDSQFEFGVYRYGQLMSVSVLTSMGSQAGGFPGRMGGQGLGPGGTLICPSCGTKVIHQRGVSCYSVQCPSCNTSMKRMQ
jgi:S1-C subfamily serine protease